MTRKMTFVLTVALAFAAVLLFAFGSGVEAVRADDSWQVILVKGDGSATVPITAGQELEFNFSATTEFPATIVSPNGFTYSINGTEGDAYKTAKQISYQVPFTITNKTKVALLDGINVGIVVTPTDSITMTVSVAKAAAAQGPKTSSVTKLPGPVTVKDDMVEFGNAGAGGEVKVKVEGSPVLLEFYSQAGFEASNLTIRALAPWNYGGVTVAPGDYTYVITPSIKSGQFIGVRAKVSTAKTESKVTVTLPSAPSTTAPAASAPAPSTTAPVASTAPAKTLPGAVATKCDPSVDKSCGPGGPAKPLSGFSGVIAWLRSLLPW